MKSDRQGQSSGSEAAQAGAMTREILLFALTILVLAVFICVTGAGRRTTAIRAEGRELVRLHVIANSDNPADQAVKIRVKDRIIRDIGPGLASAEDAEGAVAMVRAALPEVVGLARDELERVGFTYGASASVGTFVFPARAYGTLTLPAGRYQALRIVLGGGRGQNWWCVLFPPLCLVDLAVATEPRAEPTGLGVVLASAAPAGEMPIEVRWKFVEWLKKRGVSAALIRRLTTGGAAPQPGARP
jgi:stage II sporulation protein R